MQKITINDVAKYAAVSKKTVSRVLNNEANVSDKTMLKVKEAFVALSYRPNPQARGLASNQSFLIGLVYDNPNKSFVSAIQTGALEICNQQGYHLLIHPTDHESPDLLDNLMQLITQSQLDGLVLTPPFSDMKNLLKMLDESKIPYARIAATTDKSTAVSVISNDKKSAYEMTQHLISLGHVDIGFILGHPHHAVTAQRYNGYKKALSDNGLALKKQYIVEGRFDFSSGEKAARNLLGLKKPPTAIFASNDHMAAGVMKVANQKNILLPSQLSIVGFDDSPISEHIWPSLTTVRQPFKLMANKAIEMLIKCIRKEPLEIKFQETESILIVRESSAPHQN